MVRNSESRIRVPASTLVIALPLLVLLLFAFVVIYAKQQQLSNLREQIEIACRGVVANLDLTEWVPLCVSVR